MKKFILFILLLVVIFPNQVKALTPETLLYKEYFEHILEYKIKINVQSDSSLLVEESIKVYASNDKINHGIYRDFPTKYKSILGLKDATTFDVQKVTVDGKTEKYHFSDMANGIRLYIGDPDRIVGIGFHDYKITYITLNQMRFGSDETELYYNLVGTGWEFEIDKIEAQIIIPKNFKSSELLINGYSGAQGQKGNNFDYSVYSIGDKTYIDINSKTIYFINEGLTISIIFPKTSSISSPSLFTQIVLFVSVNIGSLIIIAVTLISLTLAFLLWLFRGRDPRRGVIIPLFSPPENFSSGEIRYLYKMGFDNKILASTIISMATKGYIQIVEENDEYSILKKKIVEQDLNEEEMLVVKLFGSKDTFKFKTSYSSKVLSLMQNTKKLISSKITNKYFVNNGLLLIGNITFLIVTLIIYSISYNESDEGGLVSFLMIWLTFWTFGVIALLPMFFDMFKEIWRIITGKSVSISKSLVLIGRGMFSIPFIIGEIVVLGIVLSFSPPVVAISICLQVLTMLFLIKSIKARTVLGRQLMDKIEGFRMFLSTTEEKRYEIMHQSIPFNLDLYEKYLPFAIALDVEVPWTNSFKSQIEESITSGDETYRSWYRSSNYLHTAAFINNISGFSSNFSTTISAASVSSSRSSGGSGGGSSGGGGGGGGGGGW